MREQNPAQLNRFKRLHGLLMTQAFILCLLVLPVSAREITATVTAYCACEKCCAEWSGGPTASGKMAREGITVAGPRRIKFGTRVHIQGIGQRVIQDRLAKRYDNRFDVYFADHDAAVRFGVRRLKVKIIESENVSRS